MSAVSTAPAEESIQILYSQLDFPTQKSLHAFFRSTLKEHEGLGEEQRFEKLARLLKEHCEKNISVGWSCVVGSGFSTACSYYSLVHHFAVGPNIVLLWRTVE